MFYQQSGLPQSSGNCSQFLEFYGVYVTYPKAVKVQRTFPFGHACFPWMVSVGTEGLFAKYSYFFGLEPAHDLFSAAVKRTLLGTIRIFYSSLYFFLFPVW